MKLQSNTVLNSERFGLISGCHKKQLTRRLVHSNVQLPVLLVENTVASAEVEHLPAGDLAIVKIIQYSGQ